jgi:hypothetical protein
VANKALELLGKELDMFLPKRQDEAVGQEIMARLEEGRKRVAERWAALNSDSAHQGNPESPQSRQVEAEKKIATDE